jgi:hypothetical protein
MLIYKGVAEPVGDDALTPIITKASEALMTKVNDSMTAIVDAT